MAEDDRERSSEDLTEEASPYRLEEMRQKGRVAQSRELSGLFALVASGLALYLMTIQNGDQIANFMRDSFQVDTIAKLDLMKLDVLTPILFSTMKMIMIVALPAAIAGFIMGAFGSFTQIGSVFSTDPLTPDLNRINPIQGFMRFLSMKQFYDSLRVLFRATVIVIVSYYFIKKEIIGAPRFILSDPASVLEVFKTSGLKIFLSLTGVLAVFSGFDWWLQRWEFSKSVRLTKQEQKQEHKEREGDPLIRARIRSIQREMARKRMMDAVKKADVIVTNPTHIAIALSYQSDKMEAPKVVAKGADSLAQKIKKIASEAGVPLVENVPLARTLYRSVKIGQLIPKNLYQAVAEVLAYVYRLKKRGV